MGGEPLDMLRVEAMAQRMGHDVVGHHLLMPGVRRCRPSLPRAASKTVCMYP
jgi:hypothetical protein